MRTHRVEGKRDEKRRIMKLNSLHLAGISLLTVALAGCPDETPADGCETAADCAAGELCVDGKCICYR